VEPASPAPKANATLIVESLPAQPLAAAHFRAAQPVWRPRWSRILAGGIAFAINALAIGALAHLRAVQTGATAEPERVEVRLVEDEPRADTSLQPEPVILQAVELTPPDTLPAVNEVVPGEARLEPPRMDARASPDFTAYSKGARLAAGEIATVVILVDVDSRGRVTRAIVVRSTGGAEVDEAALAYARETRWIPGHIAGAPSSMQASLTVIFGSEAQYDSRRPAVVSSSS
jgi:TonB family protein